MALTKDNLKARLAYSTVSQLGYMFLGVGIGAYTAAVLSVEAGVTPPFAGGSEA